MGICHVNKLVVGSKNTEKGSIQIYGKDIDVLKLGDATHEGGDVKIYRDASGNLQFSIDADAASNAIAVSIYGGLVAQNYLTVGQSTLYTAAMVYVNGKMRAYNDISTSSGDFIANANHGLFSGENETPIVVNAHVIGGTSTHQVKMQVDANDIVVIQAVGNGSGGIDAATKAYGLFGVTPQVQQAHIADVAAAAGDPPTKAEFDAFATKFNTLLADLEGYGHLKTS